MSICDRVSDAWFDLKWTVRGLFHKPKPLTEDEKRRAAQMHEALSILHTRSREFDRVMAEAHVDAVDRMILDEIANKPLRIRTPIDPEKV